MSELGGPVVKMKRFNCHLKNNRVTTLTFWSSVTWPFNSRWATSYGWSIVSIVIMRLSCTVMEIWSLKCWTDGRLGDFILCPMLLHYIGQTVIMATILKFRNKDF